MAHNGAGVAEDTHMRQNKAIVLILLILLTVVFGFFCFNVFFRNHHLQIKLDELNFKFKRVNAQISATEAQNSELLSRAKHFEDLLMDRLRWDYVFKNQSMEAEIRLKAAVNELHSIKSYIGSLENSLTGAKNFS
jgi:hypothetical protein